MQTPVLTPELLTRMNAYWRAANYLSVGQIYLYDNPLLKRPLTLEHINQSLEFFRPHCVLLHLTVHV